MVTLTAYPPGSVVPASYPAPEPPTMAEVRARVSRVLAIAMQRFTNESVQATAAGIRALDAGNFVTLEELEKLLEAK